MLMDGIYSTNLLFENVIIVEIMTQIGLVEAIKFIKCSKDWIKFSKACSYDTFFVV